MSSPVLAIARNVVEDLNAAAIQDVPEAVLALTPNQALANQGGIVVNVVPFSTGAQVQSRGSDEETCVVSIFVTAKVEDDEETATLIDLCQVIADYFRANPLTTVSGASIDTARIDPIYDADALALNGQFLSVINLTYMLTRSF